MRLHHVQVAMPAGAEDAARRFYGDGLGMTEVEKPADLRARGGAWFRAYDAAGAVRAEIHVGVEDPFAPARKAHPALVLDSAAELDALAARLGALGFEVDHSQRDDLPGPPAVAHLRRSRESGGGPGADWVTMSPMRLLVIFGPPAVGKMTVGRAVAARSEFRLFHNHATIEPLLDVFDYGTPPFMTLMTEWRSRVVEEAAAFGTDLVFTFVWGLEIEADAAGDGRPDRAVRRRRRRGRPSSSSWPTSTPGSGATAPSTAWRRRSPSVTSTGPTATSGSSSGT